MKTGIHPEMNDVVYIDATSGAQFITKSTEKSEEQMEIAGKKYYVIKVDISSNTHPFYTGKQMLIDTAGRVDKFRAKMAKAKKHQESLVPEKSEEEIEEETEAAEQAEKAAEEKAKQKLEHFEQAEKKEEKAEHAHKEEVAEEEAAEEEIAEALEEVAEDAEVAEETPEETEEAK